VLDRNGLVVNFVSTDPSASDSLESISPSGT
jgi:hypothetical protein